MDPNSLANLLIPIAGMATGAVIVVTVGRLIRHWVDLHYDRTGPGEDVRREIEHLRGEIAATQELEHRLAEIEERLDFTERVLTQRGAPGLQAGEGER